MGDLTESSTPPPPPPPLRTVPFREDCWTEEATSTLVDAWGRRYLELNRGNLRQKDWQEVADAVNAHHGHTKKTRRTDVQCKNRVDTLKKKYKVEKAKICDSNGLLTSSWPFFSRMDHLIGSKFTDNSNKIVPPPTLALPSHPLPPPMAYRKPNLTGSSIFMPAILPQKRPAPTPEAEVSHFRRNYSAMAAAAAAAASAAEEDEDDGGTGEEDEVEEGGDGMSRLAKAIESFAEIYERVESMKQRQMVELEKQRMQFAKDLEVQRMQLLTDMQLQFEKIKRPKRSFDDIYS